MVASECGMDGLRCCDQEPTCKYGQQCCFSPQDPNLNYCSEVCEYGKQNSFCNDTEPECESGLTCDNYKCVPCGDELGPCCNNRCKNDLICHRGVCVFCGQVGAPCCEDNTCAASGNERVECAGNICRLCGSGMQSKCQDEPYCSIGALLNGDICISCGKENQPCCKNGNKTYCLDDNLDCYMGFCSSK